jgi:hypothetical protein
MLKTGSSNDNVLNFYFFVGRLNPPHVGHIAVLQQMVDLSKTANTMPIPAIVFLGSGPRGERTLDNPVTFETKCQVVNYKIPGAGQEYEIHQRIKPEEQLVEIISGKLAQTPKLIRQIKQINIIQVAGGKDNDAGKLEYIRTIVSDKLRTLFPTIEFGTAVVSIDPVSSSSRGPAMSGTEVRKDAYLSLVDGSGYPSFQKKYTWFYGPYTARIYEEIIFPAQTGVALTIEQLSAYIQNNQLPNVSTRPRGKKGGTKRKSRRRGFKRRTIARKRR